jgi:hypothetical protein
MEDNKPEILSDLPIDYDAGNTLKKILPWTKFISIAGIVFLGLILIILIFTSQRLSDSFKDNNPDLGNLWILSMLVGVLVVIVVFGYSLWMLLRFSILVKKALETQDQESFNKGIQSMKIYSIFIGVFAALGLISNIYNLII